jgi:predicted NAD/FAD-binding protein
MRIAVVGTGISGSLCARLLATRHSVELFEANDRPGGHANTVTIAAYDRRFEVDTGFMVFNTRTYPNFLRLLAKLGIESQPSDMSFSVKCDGTGLEYQGSSLNGLFAQRRNLVSPTFLGMLRDILRFNRAAVTFVTAEESKRKLSLGAFVAQQRLGQAFVDQYLVPMGAAIWSARPAEFLSFPANFILRFLHNHGLLQLTDRPQWLTVAGRSQAYVTALLRPIQDRVRLNTPIAAVRRHSDHVEVQPHDGTNHCYDAVVFATHADQTLQLLGKDASTEETEILNAFPYQANKAILHTDASVMPRRRQAWASWNYHIPAASDGLVSLTYDLNRLQSLAAPGPICVTLNPQERIDPSKLLAEFNYAHPVFEVGSEAAQQRHDEINGTRRSYFCGAYWGYGFHEDGVNSALAVARQFDIDLSHLNDHEAKCTAVSTKDESRTRVAAR